MTSKQKKKIEAVEKILNDLYNELAYANDADYESQKEANEIYPILKKLYELKNSN